MASKKSESIDTKTATLELWGYAPEIGTAWVDSLDEVDDEVANCALSETWTTGLQLSDIHGRVTVDGEERDIDFRQVEEVKDGDRNTWAEFVDEIGIYAVDIGKESYSASFAISGDFDPKKLTLHYRTAIGPGYLTWPQEDMLCLLDHVEYDGVAIDLDNDGERNSKGGMFTVFDKGRYAEYDYGCDVSSLSWRPFPGYNWSWFGPKEWAKILSVQPQFADKCKRWKEFGSDEWAEILSRQPQLAVHVEAWGGIKTDVLSRVLANQPQFADKCDRWGEFDEDDWVRLLCSQPQFSDRCDKWANIGGGAWANLLTCQPQFAEKCDKWAEMNAGDWVKLLKAQPRFSERCDKWAEMNVENWVVLLKAQPQFETKCSKWAEMNAENWVEMLEERPQFAESCDKWAELDDGDWRRLLSKQPQFADTCDKWEKFDDIDMAYLALKQDAFVTKFLALEKISPWAAAIILANKPSVKVDKRLLDGERDEDAYDRVWEDDFADVYPFKTPWAYVLSRQPQMADGFEDWETFFVGDWLELLDRQPDLAKHCDWKMIEDEWDPELYVLALDGREDIFPLLKANTSIDPTKDMGFDEYIDSRVLVKDFDSWEWNLPQAKTWSEILSFYPEMVSKFEADVWREDDNDDD